MKTLADRVKAGRSRVDMTQEALAAAVGVRQQTIGKIETGQTLNSRKLNAIARALGCNADWLETGEGDPAWKHQPSPAAVAREPELLSDLVAFAIKYVEAEGGALLGAAERRKLIADAVKHVAQKFDGGHSAPSIDPERTPPPPRTPRTR